MPSISTSQTPEYFRAVTSLTFSTEFKTVGLKNIIRFFFSVPVVVLLKSRPRTGMSPRKGTLFSVPVVLLRIRPPRMMISLLSASTVVSIVLVEVIRSAEPAEPKPVTVTPLPQFPASERDLALLVPDTVSSGAVSELVRRFAGQDLESLEIFDLYTGEGVPEGQRSLAFRLRFRSPRRTLKDKQVDKSVRLVLKRLEEDLGVEARG